MPESWDEVETIYEEARLLRAEVERLREERDEWERRCKRFNMALLAVSGSDRECEPIPDAAELRRRADKAIKDEIAYSRERAAASTASEAPDA